MSDLRLGVRLAIGGGRTSKTGVARLVLSTIGIGLAVAVLLVGASVGPMFDARNDRQFAQFGSTDPVPGVDPLAVVSGYGEFREQDIAGTYLRPTGERAPLPPGVSRLPGAGEIVVSPALADLLAGPDGDLLRPRFPQRIIGTIDPRGVVDADALTFYAGDDSIDRNSAQQLVYGFGVRYEEPIPANLVILIAIGTVVLLVPVFVFVATSARIAGAERDRRLAALRLVGADSRQARRIAAAESLVSAATGLAFGIGLFLLFRSVIGTVRILGVRPYPSDVAPPWPLVMLIVVAVPGLAMLTAQVALRRSIIEPLGVVRRARPVRRRLLWRLVPVVLGPILLLSQVDQSRGADETAWLVFVIGGAALLLLGIPALLPWLLERSVGRLRGGRPASQLAIRRLQLDSGTAARVVGGVAVVLAGAIALEAVLAAQADRYDTPRLSADLPPMIVNVGADAGRAGLVEEVAGRIRPVPGVASVVAVSNATFRIGADSHWTMSIVDCSVLTWYAGVDRCTDGDVFRTPTGTAELTPGATVTMVGWNSRSAAIQGSEWTLPAGIREMAEVRVASLGIQGLVVTPGAVRGLDIPGLSGMVGVLPEPGRPDTAELVRNALASYGWRVSVHSTGQVFRSTTGELFVTIRNALLGGALFTLLLAGVSMLVLALEQMRERRRPLAALAATGVPTGTLARSLLWQNTIPVLLAVFIAVLTGISLAALVFRLLDDPFSMNWTTVGLFSGAAAVLVLIVTALTLPTLRSATRLAALRME